MVLFAVVLRGLDAGRAGPYLGHLVTVFAEFEPRTKPLPVFTAAQLRGLRIPVLVIAGEKDVMFDTAETVRRLPRRFRRPRCACCPVSGARSPGGPRTWCPSCAPEQ
ncbi:hypothetical protein GCM10009854_20930 [Saccharopolyspora halophila]|uniref:Uncharacterized protein n=1 Tax=Saccharopolyspora halophila TaxID=405551 RepID=A0ABN3G563_9PSEU